MRNRSRADIIATILESANGGITKTNLLLKANLTSGQLRQYLQMILSKKLMLELSDKSGKHKAYRTTELGIKYLSVYNSIKNQLLIST